MKIITSTHPFLNSASKDGWEITQYMRHKRDRHKGYIRFDSLLLSDKYGTQLESEGEEQSDGMEVKHMKVTHWEVEGPKT